MKYVVVGAVAGGATAAARLRRMDEQAEIVIFEKGAYISYANCSLPYYIGDVIKERDKLFLHTASSFSSRFNMDVRLSTEIIAINAAEKTVIAVNLLTNNVYSEQYDKLVLAPGAEPLRPPIPGIDLPGIFTLRNVTDTDFIKAHVDRSATEKAVVIGGGFIGLEMVENLNNRGVEVTLVEMGEQLLAPADYPIAALLQQHLRSQGIRLKLGTAVTGFQEASGKLKVFLNSEQTLEADMVILSIGVKPDTRLAVKAGLKTGSARGILVNKYLQTSDPDIYAVGDAIEFPNPVSGMSMPTYLAGPANKQARICANNIVFGNKQAYKGSVNTAIVKAFDLTVGLAGMSSKELNAAGIEHIVSTIHANSHAGYYPDAELMTIQIAFSPDTGRLYGAQIIGKDGVDKRLDVLSAFIQGDGSVDDLTEFEHGYAPPFSSARDPVNMAGYTAENILTNRLKVIYWNDLRNLEKDNILIDVRSANEFAAGTIKGAINIPLDDLRSRISTIPKYKTTYIFCQQGLRGYLAQRILLQNGYTNIYNISGGYLLWNACTREKSCLADELVCLN